jgi:hypothetical protein
MTDLVLVNGNIRTGEPGGRAEAIAIREGRVLAVGSNDDARAAAGSDAEVIDLGGATVIPGLIDPHNHLLSTGLVLGEIDLFDVRSLGELQARVREAAASAKPGTWLLGRGWDESLLNEQRMPNRHDLDAVAPDNPVVLERVWNKLVVNTAALQVLGIDETTPDPPEDMNYAGSFDREENGYPTGIFRDRAKDLVRLAMPQPTEDELVEAIGRASRAYNALGLTAVVEPGLLPHQLDAFQRAAAEGVLSVRTDLLMSGWGFVPAAQEPELEERIAGMRERWSERHPMARLAGVKLLPDGGIGDRTARVSEPYVGEPDNYGVWAVPENELPERIRWVHDQGWPMDIHTCGDEAQRVSVKAFADAQEANPKPELRHRVHHAYLPTPDTLKRMAKHRIPALISSPFIRSLGESYVISLGEERAERMMPYRTYLEAGVPLAGSSDTPVADHNPWVGMATTLTRRTVKGRVLGADQVLTPEEALVLYTTGAAFGMGREDELGRLAPGYVADLVVLDRDPFAGEVDPDELMATVPSRVMVDGRWVM